MSYGTFENKSLNGGVNGIPHIFLSLVNACILYFQVKKKYTTHSIHERVMSNLLVYEQAQVVTDYHN